MLFGGVHVWTYSVMALAALLLFDVRFLFPRSCGKLYGKEGVLARPESAAILVFLFICVLYVAPLSEAAIRFLSPKLASLRAVYEIAPGAARTLSVYPRATLSYIIKLTAFVLVYLSVLSRIISPPEGGKPERPRSVYPAFITLGAITGVLSILFHSFVDFNLHIPANTLYFTLLLSIIAGLRPGSGRVNYDFLGKLVNAIVAMGFLTALFGIIQWFSWNGKMFWLVPKPGSNFGPFVCYNNFAGFMEMTSFMSIAMFYYGIFTSPLRRMRKLKDKFLWFSSPEANKTVLYLFFSVVMAGALFLSRSRGGIISFALAFAVFAVVSVVISPKTRKTKLIIAAAAVLGLFVVMILWLGPENTIKRFQKLKEMFQYIMEGRKSFLILRPLMWIDTLKIIGHFPLVGAGFGAYSNIFIIERNFPADWGFLVYAHQDYLHLLAEMGAVGGLYLLMFLVWYFRRFGECVRRLKTSAENLEK